MNLAIRVDIEIVDLASNFDPHFVINAFNYILILWSSLNALALDLQLLAPWVGTLDIRLVEIPRFKRWCFIVNKCSRISAYILLIIWFLYSHCIIKGIWSERSRNERRYGTVDYACSEANHGHHWCDIHSVLMLILRLSTLAFSTVPLR